MNLPVWVEKVTVQAVGYYGTLRLTIRAHTGEENWPVLDAIVECVSAHMQDLAVEQAAAIEGLVSKLVGETDARRETVETYAGITMMMIVELSLNFELEHEAFYAIASMVWEYCAGHLAAHLDDPTSETLFDGIDEQLNSPLYQLQCFMQGQSVRDTICNEHAACKIARDYIDIVDFDIVDGIEALVAKASFTEDGVRLDLTQAEAPHYNNGGYI